jgi:lipoprotein-releasing system permease protein
MVTLIVADGMIRGITDRFLELGTGHLQIWPRRGGTDTDTADTGVLEEAAAIAGRTPGVRGVWRETDSLGVILAAGGKTGAAIRAVDPSFWEDAGSRAFLSVVEGEGSLSDDGGILLGEDLAREVGAAPGKPFYLRGKLAGRSKRQRHGQCQLDGYQKPRRHMDNDKHLYIGESV